MDALYKFNVATEEEAKRNLIPPTQGEKQHLGSLEGSQNNLYVDWQRECATLRAENAALRKRVDEATRVENEACEAIARKQQNHTSAFSEQFNGGWMAAARDIAAAIRARIAPKGEP